MSATEGLLPEELAEYKDAFDMFDIDKGGELGREPSCWDTSMTVSPVTLTLFDIEYLLSLGTIESHELQCVMARLGEVLTDKELADMMKALDSNGDGVIDFDEFVTMMKKRAKERMNEDPEIQLRAVFDKFDADKSGRIDRNEVRMIMKKLAQSLTDEGKIGSR